MRGEQHAKMVEEEGVVVLAHHRLLYLICLEMQQMVYRFEEAKWGPDARASQVIDFGVVLRGMAEKAVPVDLRCVKEVGDDEGVETQTLERWAQDERDELELEKEALMQAG